MIPRAMMVQLNVLSLMQLGLALAGAGVAGYLAWNKVSGDRLICVGFQGCDIVNNSPYAELLGVPVAVWGLGAYLALAMLALPFWGSYPPLQAWAIAFSFAIALGGWIFSMYLTFIEAFILHAWCSWCVASAILITSLMAVSGIRFYQTFLVAWACSSEAVD
ncbi:MAG: vitamin K epoxide reductase family protein [Anaerolineae bacterium]|nr:vitamin K epoxide reductase family protein [Thermoflexus sp.]MDW8065399.1 vitamin K epoxide reductase family protein [Anaerolineae bacterium]